MSSPPVCSDHQWDEERKKLIEKRLELEKRLNMRKNDALELEIQSSTKIISKPKASTIARQKSHQDQKKEDIRTIAAHFFEETPTEEENNTKTKFSSSLSRARGKTNDGINLTGRLLGAKRPQREVNSAHSIFVSEHVDDGGPLAKKQKSISKGTSTGFPTSWEEPFDFDAGSLLSKLNCMSTTKSEAESTLDESEDEESGSESESVTENLSTLLNQVQISPAEPPSKPVSRDDFLSSLSVPKTQNSHSSNTDEETGSEEDNDEPEVMKPTTEIIPKKESKKEPEKPKEDRTLAFGKKEDTKELLSILDRFRPKESKSTPGPVGTIRKISRQDKGMMNLSKSGNLAPVPEKTKSLSPKKAGKEEEEEEKLPASLKDLFPIASMIKGGANGRVKIRSSPAQNMTGKTINSNKERVKKVERKVSITTDLEGAGTTSEVLKKIQSFSAAKELESSESESQVCEKSTETESEDQEDMNCPLIMGYGVKEDMNKAGLIRGKKGFYLRVPKSKKHQMEDTNCCAFPFNKSKDMALFCVFDGHASKECSMALTTLFPKVFAQHWVLFNKDREKVDITHIWGGVYKEVDNLLSKFQDEGSTATTILIWRAANGKRYLQSANVGDSTAFLWRHGTGVIPLSQDHKPTNPAERKRIEATGTKLEPEQTRLNGLAVSRAFGDHFAKEVEPGLISDPYICPPVLLTPKDTRLILASDGLWDVVSAQRAFDLVKVHKDPVAAATKLVQHAVKNTKCNDNVTVVVINLR